MGKIRVEFNLWPFAQGLTVEWVGDSLSAVEGTEGDLGYFRDRLREIADDIQKELDQQPPPEY